MMKLKKPGFARIAQFTFILVLALGVFLGVTQWAGGVRPAHALPEYTNRTGESCGTCHVNPGGGGPRTLQGLLWAARGRPDEVPALPGILLPPRNTNGGELDDVACAGCHGYRGEGLFAIHLAETGVSKPAIRSFILNGIPASGMPAFKGQFTDEQLEALVEFVSQLTSGEIQLLDEYPLPPAQLECDPLNGETACRSK